MPKSQEIIESNANQILDVLRTNPNVSLRELEKLLSEKRTFPPLTLSMLRQYLNSLNRIGYVQKMGVHDHTYKCLKNTPYIYTPIGWKFNKMR